MWVNMTILFAASTGCERVVTGQCKCDPYPTVYVWRPRISLFYSASLILVDNVKRSTFVSNIYIGFQSWTRPINI